MTVEMLEPGLWWRKKATWVQEGRPCCSLKHPHITRQFWHFIFSRFSDDSSCNNVAIQATVMCFCYFCNLNISSLGDTLIICQSELRKGDLFSSSHRNQMQRWLIPCYLSGRRCDFRECRYITIAVTWHVPYFFPFVTQIDLDVSFTHNSYAHSWGHEGDIEEVSFSSLWGDLAELLSTFNLLSFYYFMIAKRCSLF